MIRFQLLGIPISIEPMFWVIGALFGMPFFTNGSREGLITAAIWMAVWLISFVVHEMGHAWFFRKYGGRGTHIHLYGMGGYARAEGHFSRAEHIVISSAGPGVEIACGVAAWFLFRSVELPFFVGLFLRLFSYICIFWGLFNLVPVYPLDGGQIVDAALGKGMVVTAKIGVVAGIATAIVMFTVFNMMFGAIFMGYLAYENYRRTQMGGFR